MSKKEHEADAYRVFEQPKPRPDYRVVGFFHEMGFYEEQKDGLMVPFVVDASGEEVVARYSFINQQVKWLMKDVLTVLEATITNERQLAALKVLVKDKFSAKLDWIFQQMGTVEGQLDTSTPENAPLTV